ncbi:MAG: hypothetical protein Q7W56_12090 [Candidatus Latescibacteria bacterium]|nr:hypothetical protein [Candidatus Latescibacterota bacterium]
MWKRLAMLCLLPLLLVGCNDEDCAECPDPALQPTMANLWPHEDGTGWIYDLVHNVYWRPVAPDPVAPMPTLQELHDALSVAPDGNAYEVSRGLFRLRFEGEVTTASGVTAQSLVGTYFDDDDPRRNWNAGAADGERRLLRLIARGRPDLRDRILARLGETEADLKNIERSSGFYFLHGYAFAYEDSGYYGYGDGNESHSWVYLEGDLEVGAQFSMQLVPDLIDDIWLYGQVWSIADRTVAGVEWRNVLECMYAIDMGIQEATNDEGEVVGHYRSYIYCATFFAPGFGPIMSRERSYFPGVEPEWECRIYEWSNVIAR